jgi:hypothetical protein
MKSDKELRDDFSGQAMQVLMNKSGSFTANEKIAKLAYEMADEMMKARKQGDPVKEDSEHLKPQTLEELKEVVEYLELDVVRETPASFVFIYDNHEVTYFRKSKWFSGKSVQDGRGAENLIKQLTR